MVDKKRDLRRLLAHLEPALCSRRYDFVATDGTVLDQDTFALIREDEGVTAIRPSSDGPWARISIGIRSSLDAVGLTAALSKALADAGISANVVAALRHDHVFVPWDRREEALALLLGLA